MRIGRGVAAVVAVLAITIAPARAHAKKPGVLEGKPVAVSIHDQLSIFPVWSLEPGWSVHLEPHGAVTSLSLVSSVGATFERWTWYLRIWDVRLRASAGYRLEWNPSRTQHLAEPTFGVGLTRVNYCLELVTHAVLGWQDGRDGLEDGFVAGLRWGPRSSILFDALAVEISHEAQFLPQTRHGVRVGVEIDIPALVLVLVTGRGPRPATRDYY